AGGGAVDHHEGVPVVGGLHGRGQQGQEGKDRGQEAHRKSGHGRSMGGVRVHGSPPRLPCPARRMGCDSTFARCDAGAEWMAGAGHGVRAPVAAPGRGFLARLPACAGARPWCWNGRSRSGDPRMRTTRRDLFKLGALAAASAALPGLAAASGSAPVERAKKPLDILILGGTGFTGPFQVQYALARGHRVTLFNRGRRPSPEWPGEVEQLSGDRNTGDLAALRGRRWDVCIDNPTTLPFWVRDARQVLKDSVGQYIFISTIAAAADGSGPAIGEDGPLAPYRGRDAMAETRETLVADIENLYGPLKALSEAEAHKQFGARTTIIRPGYIVGPRDDSDRFTYWPRRIAQGGEVLVPGDGRDPVQVIDGRDLAEWTIRMAENGTTGTFNA